MSNQLRIRTPGKIVRLDIPKEKLDILEKILKSNIAGSSKKNLIKQIIEGSPCSCCSGIPSLEVRYDVSDSIQGAQKIERYCDTCVKKVYEREPVL